MVTMGPRGRDAATERDRPKMQTGQHSTRFFSGNPFKGIFGANGRFGDMVFKTNPGHIAPPIDDRSSTERSPLSPRPAIFQPMAGLALPERQSQADTIREICELMELRTASSTFVLKHLSNLDFDLNKWQRNQLLATARQAVAKAWREYVHTQHKARDSSAKDLALQRMSQVPFPHVQDFKQYIGAVRAQCVDLGLSTADFAAFGDIASGVRGVEEELRNVELLAERGRRQADVQELQWLVVRKCAYWAAVEMMNARVKDWHNMRKDDAVVSAMGSSEPPVQARTKVSWQRRHSW